ncbi:MAG TPA: ATP-binding protein [Terracidiphilus sp.]|jgi:signal transduction histidine kinase|nr:ATP-binding protein [Terracidiphilus sp.]
MSLPRATGIERLPWLVRALIGCITAVVAILLTYAIAPLRPFPLLFAFPTVVLACWYLGMAGGVASALTDILLVDLFLTRVEMRLALGNAVEVVRLAGFVAVSLLLGWTVRRLALQRVLLDNRDLQQQLLLADSERLVAEERARVSEEQHDRDAFLRIALRANRMGIWVWDIKHGSYRWSDEMFRMAGREPGSVEPSFEAWTSIMHSEDAERVSNARLATCVNGSDYNERYRVVWPDKSIHWLESQGTCQFDGDGKVARVVGVLWDVTDRKQAEEAILRSEKLAIAGRLAASVAHEINNPLAAVGNLLYLVTLSDNVDAAHGHANTALTELMRVSAITQQTLKFHRQSGAPQNAMLSEIVSTVLALFHARMQAAQVAVAVHVREEKSVACMPSEVQQIFANLVSNAMDAMPRGGRLVIRLRPSRDWRDSTVEGMRVTVCDSGTGIDRAAMSRIFEPFFTTKTETGTGLGMWVVAQLVERHRGQVRAWSRPRPERSGTAVTVFLPYRPQAPSEPEGGAAQRERDLRAEGVNFLTTNS